MGMIDMNGKFYLDKLYICNFKPFAYIDSEKKPYYEIDFNLGKERASILFLGPNGYGKSSIFQAIEFVLTGTLSGGTYADKIRTINEHIIINNLEKPCFIALQIKTCETQVITIIRYAERGRVGNKVDEQREASDFHAYIFEDVFVYEQFEKDRQQSDYLKEVTKEDISKRLGEKNIQDWLKKNYIKQEQDVAFVMQNDANRLNLLNGYTENELDNYFKRFQDEKNAVVAECKELEDRLKELIGKIQKEVKAVHGEKPVCGKIMERFSFVWDKNEYLEDEPFADYVLKAKRTLEYVKNIQVYKKYYSNDLLSEVKNKEEYYKEYILTLFKSTKVAEYKSSYQKREYLLQFIEDETSFYAKPLTKTYLTDKLVADIEAVRKRKKEFQKMLNEKQKIYKKFDELHISIKGEESIISEIFDNKCPVCGSDFQNKENSLSYAIVETAEIVQSMKNILDSSLDEQQKDITSKYLDVKKMIEEEAGKEKSNEEIFKLITNMDMHTVELTQLKSELEELMGLSEQLKNSKGFCFINTDAFQAKDYQIDELDKIADDLKILIDNVKVNLDEEDDIFDQQTYSENKRQTINIQTIQDNLAEKIEQKVKQLEWLAQEKDSKEYSANKNEYDKVLNEYKMKYVKNLKLSKILNCRSNAKKKYMENVAKYLEIPLYIYSGKLMQTSQNELGITCYTGTKKDTLTQFKMTVGKDEGKGKLDITEKFSAGQKAVANIALILALRKIAVANFDVFMIDDPCQSLDELNIASFVEIMKNEFGDTQLILSTHEDKIAAYIKYKFEKTNKKICMFNVQERLYSALL